MHAYKIQKTDKLYKEIADTYGVKQGKWEFADVSQKFNLTNGL